MKLWLQKKWRFLIILFNISVIIILVMLVINFNYTDKINEVDTGSNLLNLKKPDWHDYDKLENAFTELQRNWGDSGNKRQTVTDLESNEFVQTELDRQIIKIKSIFRAEEDLKLIGLDQTFKEYARKRRRTLDDLFQKESLNILEDFKRDLSQKEIETDNQIQSYQNELENEYQLSLVNLHLQLSLADLSTDKQGVGVKKEAIQAKISEINQIISHKVLTKKEILKKQLVTYEKQRRNETDKEIADLKISLEVEYENELSDYQAKLVLNYNDWRRNQALKYAKAIEARQEQKKNSKSFNH